MTSVNTYDIFLSLIIIVCIVLVLIVVFLLNRLIRRYRRNLARHQHQLDIESSGESAPPHLELQQERYDELQRLSYLTTAAPSMELLPVIRTNSERVEDWLERRGSRLAEGDLGMAMLKSYEMLGAEDHSTVGWEWKGRVAQVERNKEEKKTEDEKKTDSMIAGKTQG
ncbi:hypothetical protein GQ44DRAFT_696474, partial [Phaeosphaeriaceae sp. PMI808]